MMPAVTQKEDRTDDPLWNSLKRYILAQRKRQKEEQEADAEVLRQRREREQKQKQDVMTLGETKEQISELEAKLASLTEEKHQLFLTLKKVLNEDDNRRRLKETTTDMVQQAPSTYAGMAGQQQMFLQPMQNRVGPLYKVCGPGGNAPGAGGTKRVRSPSPTGAQGPHSYHPYSGFKAAPNFQQHKPEEGRRNHEYVRAVLWNKSPAVSYGGVYGVTPSQPTYSYGQAGGSYEQVFLPRTAYENKGGDAEKLYLRGTPSTIVNIHGQQQTSKPVTISAGFPVRPPHQRQPHSVYLAQGGSSSGRLLYGTAATSVPSSRYQNPNNM